MPASLRRADALMESVAAEMAAWKGCANFGDGLRPTEHARAHLAAMSPERRAQLEKEWNDG